MMELMCQELGVPLAFVAKLANGASHEYKQYYITKRDGGLRTIHHPSKRLKAVQRWLAARVLSAFPIHPAAQAYIKCSNILLNAQRHCDSRFLLRMDFKNFFPSLTASDLEAYARQRPQLFTGYAPIDHFLLKSFLFRFGKLTIGAPTSPVLSNVLCYELDSRLASLSENVGVVYTRYADDLFFSTSTPNLLQDVAGQVPAILRSLTTPSGLIINETKTRHSSRKGSRKVTGIVLGSDGDVHIGRKKKREVRALIHQYEKLTPLAKASLAGKINHLMGLEPDFINSLILKYGLSRVRAARGLRPS